MTNKGNVKLDFSWQVIMEEALSHRKSVTFADDDQLRLPSRCGTSAGVSMVYDAEPFVITPDCGTILPLKKQNYTVMFSPLDMSDFEGRLICRYGSKIEQQIRL